MRKLIFTLFISCSLIGYSQNIKENRIKEVLSTLASDEMKGRLIGTPENEAAANYIAEQFKANNLDYCVGDSYLVPFEFKGKTVYNVCGIKKGKSDKYLAFSGHFDHLGIGRSKDGDNIYNGADDDASGVTVVITLSDYFKDKETDFSHLYIAFNGEEMGLLGSDAIANNEGLENVTKNIQTLFNFEMLGLVSAYGENVVYMTGDEYSNLIELINEFAENGLEVYPDPYKGEGLFYRSDNVNYVNRGVVAHSFSTVDMSTQKHYHRVNDDVNVIDFKNMYKLINSFAKTIEKLNSANFNPEYNDKFKEEQN